VDAKGVGVSITVTLTCEQPGGGFQSFPTTVTQKLSDKKPTATARLIPTGDVTCDGVTRPVVLAGQTTNGVLFKTGPATVSGFITVCDSLCYSTEFSGEVTLKK
jgi:hypothetical protein